MGSKINKKHVLVFYPHNFYELSSGTHRRIYDLLCYLKSREFSLDLLSLNGFSNRWNPEEYALKDFFQTIKVCEWKQSFTEKCRNYIRKKQGRLPNRAIRPLRRVFKEMTTNTKYDFILINYVFWAFLIDDIQNDVCKVIELHDFITLNLYLQTERDRFNYGLMFQDEIRLISKFDYALCISEEMLFLNPFCPKTKFINSPISFPKKNLKNQKYDFDLLFVGSDNNFNREGMDWFMKKVYPILSSDLSIAIVGNISNSVENKKNIHKFQYIPDLDDIYQKSKISCCSLKGGTGLKVKVVEALSYGKPVVTTSWGLSGIVQKSDNGCIVADHEKEFADSVLSLIHDDDLYQRMQMQAKNFYESHFTADICYKALDSVFLRD